MPLWYDRDDRGVPRGWVQRMKAAIQVAGRRFYSRAGCCRTTPTRYYAPILRGDPFPDDPPLG